MRDISKCVACELGVCERRGRWHSCSTRSHGRYIRLLSSPLSLYLRFTIMFFTYTFAASEDTTGASQHVDTRSTRAYWGENGWGSKIKTSNDARRREEVLYHDLTRTLAVGFHLFLDLKC